MLIEVKNPDQPAWPRRIVDVQVADRDMAEKLAFILVTGRKPKCRDELVMSTSHIIPMAIITQEMVKGVLVGR